MAPSPDLDHLIDRYWIVEWELARPYVSEVVTHPAVHLVFEPQPLVYGVVTKRFRRVLTGSGRALGVKFRPAGFRPFFGGVHALTDRAVAARTIFGAEPDGEIAAVEAFLRERMPGPDPNWARLALDLGYFDQAHLIKDFKAVIGRSPAEYAALR